MDILSQIRFTIVCELTDDPVVTVDIDTPRGHLRAMATVTVVDREGQLRDAHVQGPGAGAQGLTGLRLVMQAFLVEFDLDAVVLEGAVRTSGAKPGRRPRPVRFTRSVGR